MLAFLIVIIGGALAVGLSGNRSAANGCDPGMAVTTHTVTIRDRKVSDANVTAQLCDKLTIANKDDETRLIAFGVHDKHTTYDGVSQRLLGHDKELTVTLNKTGTYHWHDHEHDEVEGYFTVSK